MFEGADLGNQILDIGGDAPHFVTDLVKLRFKKQFGLHHRDKPVDRGAHADNADQGNNGRKEGGGLHHNQQDQGKNQQASPHSATTYGEQLAPFLLRRLSFCSYSCFFSRFLCADCVLLL